MAIKRVSVTVDVDGASCTLGMSDFTDGGAKIWANLEKQAADVAKLAAKQLKDAMPNLPDEPEEEGPEEEDSEEDD